MLLPYSLGRAFLACDAAQKCKACCDLNIGLVLLFICAVSLR